MTFRVSPFSRISKHFTYADFMGNHSVYSRGLANDIKRDFAFAKKHDNAVALCERALEPILQTWGPMSISYGIISPELSEEIVKYQDPAKPSHHRFDLGAAVDICVHDWVQGNYLTEWHAAHDTSNNSAANSPIALAHEIDRDGIPYSRLISYSESPYLCIAVSAKEIAAADPRKAFYENRYTGRAKVKPQYNQLSSETARHRHFEQLRTRGLGHDWEGAGYPTYHGGGRRQYHHMRVSRYTMVSDWLFDERSVIGGEKNVPSLNLESVEDSFAAAGIVYDDIIAISCIKRFTIARAYLSHLNSGSTADTDWRDFQGLEYELIPPHGTNVAHLADALNGKIAGTSFHEHHGRLLVVIEDKENVIATFAQRE